MGRRSTVPERNVAAEARGVETGHRARVQPDGTVLVTSDTHGDLGKRYRVTAVASASTGLIRFRCVPEGPRAFDDDHLDAAGEPGTTPCMHAALAARALERHRLARYDEHGRWTAADRVLVSRWVVPDDPLDGVPR